MNVCAYETFLAPDIIEPDTSFNSEYNNAESLTLRSREHHSFIGFIRRNPFSYLLIFFLINGQSVYPKIGCKDLQLLVTF